MTATPLFDRLAPRYDELWTNTAIGRAQRDLTWRDMDPLFRPGERILDIGCGTGEDALHFTARGIDVYATDASPAMVEVSRSRGVRATVCRAEDIPRTVVLFDGAVSNFGALNCVEDLHRVGEALSFVIRPGGRVAICLLGRFCAWETLHYALRLNFAKATRRFVGQVGNLRGVATSPAGSRENPASAGNQSARRMPSCPTDLTVYYPTTAQIRTAFSPHFELQRWTGIGLLVPPSYVHLPALVVSTLSAADRILARLPLLRAMADHRLFILVRKTC